MHNLCRHFLSMPKLLTTKIKLLTRKTRENIGIGSHDTASTQYYPQHSVDCSVSLVYNCT